MHAHFCFRNNGGKHAKNINFSVKGRIGWDCNQRSNIAPPGSLSVCQGGIFSIYFPPQTLFGLLEEFSSLNWGKFLNFNSMVHLKYRAEFSPNRAICTVQLLTVYYTVCKEIRDSTSHECTIFDCCSKQNKLYKIIPLC